MRLGLASVMVWWAAGCVSNPTPHPGVADTHGGAADTAWAGRGPDQDNDGVPDCDEAGGVWSGSGCDLTDQPTGTVDAIAEGDATAPTGSDAYEDGEEAAEVAELGVEDAAVATGATGASEAGPSD